MRAPNDCALPHLKRTERDTTRCAVMPGQQLDPMHATSNPHGMRSAAADGKDAALENEPGIYQA